MNSFEVCMDFVEAWEGGHVKHPNDPGGETYCGISRRRWPNWEGWAEIDKRKSPVAGDLLIEEVDAFYWEHFWEPIKGEHLPELWQLPVFLHRIPSCIG